jgi:GT2 family glycosyltransferase
VGGFREGFEGAQDYDLFLRLVQRIDPARIAHIPRVLYHWRAHAGSTALAHGEKSYAVPAGLRSLAEHLAATGVRAVAEPGLKPTIYRVRWAVPEPAPLASIVIATRDRIALLSTCIESIRARTTYRPYEIVVADNDSVEPETRTYLAQLVREGVARVVPYPGAFNFSAINNAAARQSGGDVLVFVNNDVEVIEPEWLTELVAQASRPEIGAVGAKLLYADGRLQHAGLILGIGGVAGHAFKRFPRDTLGANGRAVMIQAVSAVTAACMAVRREVFDEVGGFDAQALAVAFNDVDFCLRVMRAGYRNVYTPYALLYHHESASRGSDDVPEKAARFQAEVEVMLDRWGDALGRDFAYNPNLTLGAEDFGLAWPPRIAD